MFFNNPVEELQAVGQYIRHGRVYMRVTYVYLFLYPDSVANCPVLLNMLTQLLAAGPCLVFFNNPVEELQAVGQYIWHGRVYMRVTFVYLFLYPDSVAKCPVLLNILLSFWQLASVLCSSTIRSRNCRWLGSTSGTAGCT